MPSFDVHGDPATVSQRWKRWLRAVKLYFTGRGGVEKDEQRQALLLHIAGFEVQDLFYSLAGEEAKTYEETLKILEEHFVPKKNVSYERHLFRQLAQNTDETTDQFVCRLRQRSVNCDFGVTENDQIRDQLIDKCQSTHLRRKLLEKEKLTLDDALKIARAQEAVEDNGGQSNRDQRDTAGETWKEPWQEDLFCLWKRRTFC